MYMYIEWLVLVWFGLVLHVLILIFTNGWYMHVQVYTQIHVASHFEKKQGWKWRGGERRGFPINIRIRIRIRICILIRFSFYFLHYNENENENDNEQRAV